MVYTGLTPKSMHRWQICELEFAFYVHYFTVYFIDHGILVCEQALYFLWWRVTWAIRDPSLTHATSAWFFTASFPAGNRIRAIATSNPVKKRPSIHFFFLYPFFFLLFFFFKKWNLIWKCINILPLALKWHKYENDCIWNDCSQEIINVDKWMELDMIEMILA